MTNVIDWLKSLAPAERAALSQAQTKETAFAETRAKRIARLTELKEAIATADADSDAKTAARLRAERATLEDQERDSALAAIKVADAVKVADQRAADAEVPLMVTDIRSEADRFVALVAQANVLSSSIRLKSNLLMQRSNAMSKPPESKGPGAFWRQPSAMPHLAARIYRDLAEIQG